MIQKNRVFGMTIAEVLGVIAIIFLIALYLLPPIQSPGRHYSKRMKRMKCARKLTDLYQAAATYAEFSIEEGGGDGIFPFAGKDARAHEHLQLLVNGGFLKEPQKLKCPVGEGAVAKPNQSFDPTVKKPWSPQEAPFVLEERTTSYAWVNHQVFSDSGNPNQPLAADKYERGDGVAENNHKNGRNVLMATGKTRWIKTRGSSSRSFSDYKEKLVGDQ